MGVFHVFKLYKWYQIPQCITKVSAPSGKTISKMHPHKCVPINALDKMEEMALS